jgi:hypothetical protein
MARPRRDSFSAETIRTLEVRAGTMCSNPDCRAHTTGAHTEPNKVLRVGVAAHIAAASPGGARYDAGMQPQERSHILNGIWLCESCAKLIDSDPTIYSVTLLIHWKTNAETRTRELVQQGRNAVAAQGQPAPHMDVEMTWVYGKRFIETYSNNNPFKEDNGQRVMMINFDRPIIIHWKLGWHYELRLYNNSRREMFNVSIEVAPPGFDSITQLPNLNNLEPLNDFTLDAATSQNFEGTSEEADAVLKQDYPAHLEGMALTIRYRDDQQQTYAINYRLLNGNLVAL